MKIAVFCGSRIPTEPIYLKNAIKLANYFVENKITLIYGGATVGIMGVIADTMLDQKGTVIGVMPKVLTDQEISHAGLSNSLK